MNNIYIFGHKNPDTDSICASISLSYLKNKLGYKTQPMALGNLNNETKYVLNYFNVKEPNYLNDVKLQIKDIEYIKDCYISYDTSINESYNYMREKGITGLPIVDENKKLLGMITLKELARELIEGDFVNLNTSYDNIISTLNGKEVLKFDDKINGSIIAAAFKETTFFDNIKLTNQDILIVGDRHNILEYAIASKVKLIIIVGGTNIEPKELELAKQNCVNIIKTDFDTYHTSKLINLSNYISSISYCENPICVDCNEYYTQFEELAKKTKHTNYPIITKSGECLGLFPLTLSVVKNPKEVILVDHNEKEQSVDGLDEATIVEVVDHHKLGTLATALPINFRNMAVGSSNTIIYNIYMENKIEIPKDIAGLMLSGILSDTLILKSPTTTLFDRKAVVELSKIADVSYEEYGLEMFKAGSSLSGKSLEDILYGDFKKFSYGNYNIGIGQVSTTDYEYVLNKKDEFINLLNNNKEYGICCLFVTDIITNGSYILYNDAAYDILMESYDLDELYQGYYLEKVVSRKKQIIPPILETLEKYN